MARRNNSSVGYGVLALIAIIISIFSNKIVLAIIGVLILLGVVIAIVYFTNKNKKEQRKKDISAVNTGSVYAVMSNTEGSDTFIKYDINDYPGEVPAYLARALEAEAAEDFLAARIAYMQAVEMLKRATQKEYNLYIKPLQKMYDEFVLRDPYYKKLMHPLLTIIERNNGILQSDITKRFESSDWGTLKFYNRSVLKDDIYYALYFADRFGHIVRIKKGRSYLLYLPGTEPPHIEDKNELR